MVSPELLRRYAFFAGLSMEQIVTLAKTADEVAVETEHYFFHEGDELDHFYLVLEGEVGILIDRPEQRVDQPTSQPLTDDFKANEIVISTIGPGEMFAWSALVPSHNATSSGKALTPSRVISFDCRALREIFKEDDQFSYAMMQNVALVIRERLRDMRIESLSVLLAHA